jgi:hypothetical protein
MAINLIVVMEFETNLGKVRKIFVTKTIFVTESNKSLFEAM